MADYIDIDSEGFSADELADIKLCLQTLLSVRSGEQPMDRDFGVDLDGCLDAPMDVAQNLLYIEITGKVERYEPRVAVDAVTFETDPTDGRLSPVIHFVKAD